MKRSFFNPSPTALRWQIGIISLVCGAIVLQNVPVLAQLTRAQAQTYTVRIDRPNGENGGSGVLVNREGNRYTVLTNCHVLQTKKPFDPQFYPISGTYHLEINGDRYPVSITSPQCHPRGIDLAIIQFQSDKDYPIPPSDRKPIWKSYSTNQALPVRVLITSIGNASVAHCKGDVFSLDKVLGAINGTTLTMATTFSMIMQPCRV